MSAATFERELRVLEEALRRLSAEYDAFLYGSVPKPPIQTRRNVEEMVRRLNASEDMASAERYRFGALQGRFSALCDRWEKLQGEKEAGRRPGLYGHFRESGGRSTGHSAPAPNAGPPASVQEERRAAPPEPDRELFDRYLAANFQVRRRAAARPGSVREPRPPQGPAEPGRGLPGPVHRRAGPGGCVRSRCRRG